MIKSFKLILFLTLLTFGSFDLLGTVSGSSSGSGSTYSEAYSNASSQLPSGASVYNKGVIRGSNHTNWIVTLFWKIK